MCGIITYKHKGFEMKKAIKATKIVRENGEIVELGESPTGVILLNGDVFTYDNTEIVIPLNEEIKIFDEEGIEFDENSIQELLAYFEEYAEVI